MSVNTAMKKYISTIKVKGQSIKTTVFADSSIHAKLLLQYQFGMNCILSNPTLVTKENLICQTLDEVIKTIKPIKPLTIDQARIQDLKRQDSLLKRTLDRERLRQHQKKLSQIK